MLSLLLNTRSHLNAGIRKSGGGQNNVRIVGRANRGGKKQMGQEARRAELGHESWLAGQLEAVRRHLGPRGQMRPEQEAAGEVAGLGWAGGGSR